MLGKESIVVASDRESGVVHWSCKEVKARMERRMVFEVVKTVGEKV